MPEIIDTSLRGKIVNRLEQLEIGEDDLDGYIRIYFEDGSYVEISSACSYHELSYIIEDK